MKQIQIYEVENTNLLYIVTDRNQDASYYSKSNLKVEAVDQYVVIWNNDVQFFKELPRDFITPLESSVVDLVEIIQGFINNILPVSNDELDALKELIEGNEERNDLLETISEHSRISSAILIQQKITNKILMETFEVEVTERDLKNEL